MTNLFFLFLILHLKNIACTFTTLLVMCKMPLNPTVANSATEPPPRSIIAMAINGVPAYGPQEGGSTNAVEPSGGSSITDAQYWYGHAGMFVVKRRFSNLSSFSALLVSKIPV